MEPVLKNGKFFVFENGFSLLFLLLRKFRRKCGETAAFFVGTIISYYYAQAKFAVNSDCVTLECKREEPAKESPRGRGSGGCPPDPHISFLLLGAQNF